MVPLCWRRMLSHIVVLLCTLLPALVYCMRRVTSWLPWRHALGRAVYCVRHAPSLAHRAASRVRWRRAVLLCAVLPALHHITRRAGLHHLLARPFYYLQLPLHLDLPAVVEAVLQQREPRAAPLNTDNFAWILDAERRCRDYDGEVEDVYLLYVVTSRLAHAEARQAVRGTWAQEGVIPGLKTRLVFLVGVHTGGHQELQQRVAVEHQQHEDIVQAYLDDSATNSTTRLRLALHWAHTRCPSAAFIMLADDAYFVSPFNLARYVRRLSDADAATLVAGSVRGNLAPSRDPTSLRYVSLEEYPFLFWPPYPAGGFALLSAASAHRLYIAAHYVQLVTVRNDVDDAVTSDDAAASYVFLGVVAWKTSLRVRHMEHVCVRQCDAMTSLQARDVIASRHGRSGSEARQAWKKHYSLMNLLGRTS